MHLPTARRRSRIFVIAMQHFMHFSSIAHAQKCVDCRRDPFVFMDLASYRRSAHQHAQISIPETDGAKVLSERTLASIEKALVDVSSEDGASRPPYEVIRQFFQETRSKARVVELLKKGVWDWEVQLGLKGLGIKYDVSLVTVVLRGDISCDVTLSFFRWLKGVRGFKHNEYTYGAMLNALGRAGRLHEMQKLFNEMEADACLVTPVTLSNMMMWYFKAKDMKGIAAHWKLLHDIGARLSPAVYAAYIDYLVRRKRYLKVAIVFEEMLRLECLPNGRVYAIFIKHLVDSGNLEGACKVMQIMQSVHLVPCRVTYKTIINAFAASGNAERVLELLEEMGEHFHRPTRQFMPAVKVLQAAGKLEAAAALQEEIFSVSSSADIEISDIPDDEDVNDSEYSLSDWRAISSLNLGFDVNAFVRALSTWDPKVEEVLEQADVQWEPFLVIGILNRLRTIDLLWPFFHWVKDKAGFRHDSYTCASLINRIFKSRSSLGKKASLVAQLFEELRCEGMKSTVPMFNQVMRFYVGAGEGDRVFSLFKLMKEVDLKPNSISYALVVEGCAKNNQVERVNEVLTEMEEKCLYLSSSAQAQYIMCLASVGKLEDAYTFFCKARISGKHFGSDEYAAIISAYDRAGNNTMGLQLYDEMKEAGIQTKQEMHKVVVKVLQQADRPSDVQAWTEERKSLDFFGGKRKELQEKILLVLSIFLENFRPNPQNLALSQLAYENT